MAERSLVKDITIVLFGAILLGLATKGQFWTGIYNTTVNGFLTVTNLLAGGSGSVKVA